MFSKAYITSVPSIINQFLSVFEMQILMRPFLMAFQMILTDCQLQSKFRITVFSKIKHLIMRLVSTIDLCGWEAVGQTLGDI